MNKTELINAVSGKVGVNKKDTEAVLNGILDTIAVALRDDDKVDLVGFGTFETNKRPNEALEIARKVEPVFKGATILINTINTKPEPPKPTSSPNTRRR